MSIRCRYNFLNKFRYGTYSEQSYRNNFEKGFNFIMFKAELINHSCSLYNQKRLTASSILLKSITMNF